MIKNNKKDNIVKWTIVSIFVGLYSLTSVISTIHVIDFFTMSNNPVMATTLAIAFEIGAAACLGAIVILNRTSRWLVWCLFILITGIQIQGNMYYAYSHMKDFQSWVDLFGMTDSEPIFQKRILSLVSGAILPIVALGFIKSLVDYIRPNTEKEEEAIEEAVEEAVEEVKEDIEEIKEDSTISESEKNKKIESKIKKAILHNPELKEKISEEIKKLDDEDKYTKTEESPIADINQQRRTYGGM